MQQIATKATGLTHRVQISVGRNDDPEIIAVVTRCSHGTEFLRFNSAPRSPPVLYQHPFHR